MPREEGLSIQARVGQKVKAGETVLAIFNSTDHETNNEPLTTDSPA